MILPGIRWSTAPNDYFPIKQMQMARFNGEHTVLFGPIINSETGW